MDLRLALARTRADHLSGRVFIQPPFELELVTAAEVDWLQDLGARVTADQYHPSPAWICNVPKGKGAVRPAAVLSLADQVVYAAAVGECLGAVAPILKWVDPPIDCAYQPADVTSVNWLQNRFACWEEFRQRSLGLLDDGAALVVVTDVTGFYENIALEVLASDLNAANASKSAVALLGKCLSRWAVINGRGIPQGFSASDFLAKLYLTNVDRALKESGFGHVRYVDDTRVFCRNMPEAKRVLIDMAQLLRSRGLSLQGAKTRILDPMAARDEFEGAIPVIKPLAKRFVEEIAREAGKKPNYFTTADAERLVAEGKVKPPVSMLKAAYDVYFVKDQSRFDKSLFHYVLRRLGKVGDGFAVEHVVSLLEPHPEETDEILAYLGSVVVDETVSAIESALLRYLTSDEAVYEYQHYQVIRWRYSIRPSPSSEFLAYVRKQVVRFHTSPHLIAACRAVLGRFGSPADLEALLSSYSQAKDDLERAQLICSLARLERNRRNGFLGQVRRNDGFLAEVAARCVKQGRFDSAA